MLAAEVILSKLPVIFPADGWGCQPRRGVGGALQCPLHRGMKQSLLLEVPGFCDSPRREAEGVPREQKL